MASCGASQTHSWRALRRARRGDGNRSLQRGSRGARPPRLFDEIGASRTLTIVTDLSRADVDDVVGGYAFVRDLLEVIFP